MMGSLGNLGSAYYSMGRVQEAIGCYEQAITVADEIDERQTQNEARWGLAQAQLFLENLPAAREAVEEAHRHKIPGKPGRRSPRR